MRFAKPSRKLVVVVTIILLLCALSKWYNYREAQSWIIKVNKPAPVYENYDTWNRSNSSKEIVGYLLPGQKTEILDVTWGKEWPRFDVLLPDGRRGYVLYEDVEAERVR